MTTNTIGPSKLVTARPISAPYSSCRDRIDSGEPSKPERLASTTTGRLPLAVLMARATFFDDWGNRVPEVHTVGPSPGTSPSRATGLDSRPTRHTGIPPMWVSHTTAVSACCQRSHRSSGRWSASLTARMTERMSKGFLRSAFRSAEKTSPTVAKSLPSTGAWGDRQTSRSTGSVVVARRGNRSPGTT